MPDARALPGRVSPVNRRRTLLSGALLAALVLSSCGAASGDDHVARVNGHELTDDELRTLAEGSTEGADLRAALSFWVRVVSVLDDPTGVASPETSQDRSEEAQAQVVADHSESGRAVYEQGLAASPLLCLRAIPLQPGVPGQQVVDEIDAGLSFEDAATKYSSDPDLAANGGVVLSEGQECFENAGLQQSQPAFYQLLVESNVTVGKPGVLGFSDADAVVLLRPYDDVPTSARNQLAAEEVGNALRDDYYVPADVSVSSRFGVWDPTTGEVVAYSGE